MKIKRIVTTLLVPFLLVSVSHAQIPVVGGKGAGLSAIAGTDTLVTVVLKGSGAKDPNLKVVAVEGGILTVRTQTGQVTSYRVADVQEIQVQGEVMKVRAVDLMADRGMTSDQQEIVSRALVRATELFNASVANQSLRMYTAEILAVGGVAGDVPGEALGGSILPKQQAIDYLTALVNGNDLRTGITAALHLSIAGQPIPSPTIIQDGLASGDRLVKSSAAKLAGLTEDRSVMPELRLMIQDRAANISAPAARALSTLGDKDIIPTLIAMAVDRNPDKAEAGCVGLIKLGDESVAQQLKMKLKDTEGLARFRVAWVLHDLGDPQGGAVLRDELMEVPSLQFDSARVLALKGDVKAMQYLRDWLGQRRDPSESLLIQRAQATHALIKAGDRTNAGVLQDVIREGSANVQITALKLIADLDINAFLPMILPVLTSNDPATVVTACQTAVAVANNDYGQRLRVQRS
ncbi:MAG: hypothetical protein HUU46_05460 [Candidatus Hydrogenedentes bacterium]|nr:hypothetical protein [Candidatus Hydrogenedentota bacterium]